jgi:hypothetical protein
MTEHTKVALRQERDFRFAIDFGPGIPELHGDEAPPPTTEGRLRVTHIRVAVTLGAPAMELPHLDRVLGQFERLCTVAQSVGQGIPIEVTVADSTGSKVK